MKEQIAQPEKKEIFEKVELIIEPPVFDKGYMVAYEGKTKAQCTCYNGALMETLKAAKLNPFFQVGPNNEPGYHAFECWAERDETTKKKIESVIPEIHQNAEDHFKSLRKHNLI